MKTKLEYVWLDGYKPEPNLRSKVRIIEKPTDNITVMDISGKVIAKYNVAAGVNYGTIMKPAAGTYFVQVTAADGSSAASTLVFE